METVANNVVLHIFIWESYPALFSTNMKRNYYVNCLNERLKWIEIWNLELFHVLCRSLDS